MEGKTSGGPNGDGSFVEGKGESSPNKRCRISMKQSSKGAFQIEVTAEYDTPEESGIELQKALDEAFRVAAEKGLQLAG